MNGVLLVDKETGMTSHDVVAKARRLLGIKSIGHAGTLDPMASGLLLLLVGEATKISDYLLTGDKGYEVSVRLGVRTDSMDMTGVVLEERSVSDLSEERIRSVALSVTGTVELAVPMHSAVKVNGKKLYESAHKGEIPAEIPIRPMSFYGVEWVGMTTAAAGEFTDVNGGVRHLAAAPEFTIRLCCSKGSFIRAWANHVGQLLGCGGTVTVLRRVMSAPFEIEAAKTLGSIDPNALGSEWIPLAEALPHLGKIEIEGFDATLLRNGQLSKGVQAELLRSIQLGVQPQPVKVIHKEERRLLALLAAEPGEFYKIRRVFQ